jgi:hypothetical protein
MAKIITPGRGRGKGKKEEQIKDSPEKSRLF